MFSLSLQTVLAGMPSFTLSDAAHLRIQSISFFLAGFCISAFAVQFAWNFLRRDFTRLPQLSYPKALAMVALWGLLFIVVLTMISGARELLTPGAWKKEGATYQLALVEDASSLPREKRIESLEKLRAALWDYAKARNGKLPPHNFVPEIDPRLWLTPDNSGARYVYLGGEFVNLDEASPYPVAYEPRIYGPSRYVLLSNGKVQLQQSEEILRYSFGMLREQE